ncbi:caspase-3-like [Ptychodera flava]|uniref:caspase-3-like n=1 Tax=Ptychodera flava TaxID=63121 RepID=UPI00396A852E
MEPRHKDILRRNRVRLAEEMVPKFIYPKLIERNIYKPFMIEDIEAKGSRYNQNNELLNSIETRGRFAFDAFVDGLIDSGQTDLAELLRPTGPIQNPTIPTALHQPIYTERNNIQAHPNVWPPPGVSGVFTDRQMNMVTTPSKEQTDSDEIYRMKSKPRGLAFILNNKVFTNGMKRREGSDIDCKNLQHVFKELGFENHVKNDLTGKEILLQLDKFAQIDHSNYDCCIISILTHGIQGSVYGTDGELIKIEDITSKFNGTNCPGLLRKPKLFFLQACRGESFDRGTSVDAMDAARTIPIPGVGSANEERMQVDEAVAEMTPEQEEELAKKMLEVELRDEVDAFASKQTVPNEGDMLLAYATVPGYVSWRNSERGSWFIQAITEVFLAKAATEDVLSMLTMVNAKVALAFESSSGRCKQMPAPVTMLTKKLYFFPGFYQN